MDVRRPTSSATQQTHQSLTMERIPDAGVLIQKYQQRRGYDIDGD